MKRILLSLLTISLVSAVAFGATQAYFTDTETKTGNTFAAGTIDIAVNGENPWTSTMPYQLTDMKPSQVNYANFVIQNVGTNPANVWKKVLITKQEDGVISEPECLEGNGTWNVGTCTVGYTPYDNIASVIRYDLKVWIYSVNPTEHSEAKPEWWQYIYTDDMDVRLSALNDQNVLLGMIPAGWYMKVEQSYHMDSATTNWAQGDKMTFNITLNAEQLKGTVLLENKNFANQVNPTIVHDDGIQGTLTYGVKDSKFNYSFVGKVPLLNTEYKLVFYPETWSTPSGVGWPGPVIVLGTTTSGNDGSVNIPTTSVELGQNILKMKVWLVTSADLKPDNTFQAWNGNNYLFELGLMDYYYTGI